jgi:hypothetical protein
MDNSILYCGYQEEGETLTLLDILEHCVFHILEHYDQ